nr:Chain B, DNA polymerase eta [Homo sapiens]
QSTGTEPFFKQKSLLL